MTLMIEGQLSRSSKELVTGWDVSRTFYMHVMKTLVDNELDAT